MLLRENRYRGTISKNVNYIGCAENDLYTHIENSTGYERRPST